MFEKALSFLSMWLTPTLILFLLNLIIFTVLFSSSSPNSASAQSPPSNLHPQLSIIQRLKSLNFYDYTPAPPLPPQQQQQQPLSKHMISTTNHETTPTNLITETSFDDWTVIEEHDFEGPTMDEIYTRITQSTATPNPPHYGRQNFDTKPAGGEIPVRLPRKMKKSASDKSAFNHFEAAAAGEEEVDSRADDFINKFKQQLEMQRMDSIQRYKEMIVNVSAK